MFIDYNISGMSYVHLTNALFLQPLPEQSSVPCGQQPTQHVSGKRKATTISPGIFISSTVPETLVARPPGQGATLRTPGDMSRDKRSTTEEAGRRTPLRGPEPVILPGDTEEVCMLLSTRCVRDDVELLGFCTSSCDLSTVGAVDSHRLVCGAQLTVRLSDLSKPELPLSTRQAAQDLLAGISMSQLFSPPSSPSRASRFHPYKQDTPKATSFSGNIPASSASARKRPALRWWERQSTTELEITGTVDDVINPSLLAAGRAEAGGNAMAVASLRELWDEEKERSRVAGGGSQLSAPPGLELADSQDVWEPPEGLLTQDMRGAVDNLARNVLRRNCAEEKTGVPSGRQPSSQPLSQALSGNAREQPLCPQMELTPLPDGLSQASADIAGASASPSNYLPALDGGGGDDVDPGLLDMLAALRGSQSQRDGNESELSSPRGARYIRSPSYPRSQEPVFTPASSVEQAEAIAETQVLMPTDAPLECSCCRRLESMFLL